MPVPYSSGFMSGRVRASNRVCERQNNGGGYVQDIEDDGGYKYGIMRFSWCGVRSCFAAGRLRERVAESAGDALGAATCEPDDNSGKTDCSDRRTRSKR